MYFTDNGFTRLNSSLSQVLCSTLLLDNLEIFISNGKIHLMFANNHTSSILGEKKESLTTSLIFSFLFLLRESSFCIPSLCWRYSTTRLLIYSYVLPQRSTASVFLEATTNLAESSSPIVLNTPPPFRATNFQELDNLPGPCTHINKLTLNKEKVETSSCVCGRNKNETDLLFFLSPALCSPPSAITKPFLSFGSNSFFSQVVKWCCWEVPSPQSDV